MAQPKHFPDKAERRQRRNLAAPKPKIKGVKTIRSKRCRCPEACHLHGRFQPLQEPNS